MRKFLLGVLVIVLTGVAALSGAVAGGVVAQGSEGFVIEGVTLIENPVSRAPGFQIENVFVLPGVPSIMQAMFDGLKHRLRGGAPVLSKTVTAFIPESVVAPPLGELQDDRPDVDIGSYPFFRDGKLGTSLVARSTDGKALEEVAEAIRELIRGLGGEPHEGD